MKRSRSLEENRLELEGEWDLDRRAELDSLFARLRPGTQAVIDMRRLTYLDSTVLNKLAALQQRLDCQITLLGPSPQIYRILCLVSFDKLFRIVKVSS